MLEQHIDSRRQGTFWRDFPPVIPYGIIDSRIADLALGFWQNPDDRILTAYKRLEDIIRTRTGLKGHGTKLFSKAFSGETAQLYWKDIDDGEKTGRANLFTGAFMAHRNPLAHRETKNYPDQQLTESLLLNTSLSAGEGSAILSCEFEVQLGARFCHLAWLPRLSSRHRDCGPRLACIEAVAQAVC